MQTGQRYISEQSYHFVAFVARNLLIKTIESEPTSQHWTVAEILNLNISKYGMSIIIFVDIYFHFEAVGQRVLDFI